jgi:hypothetical protein
MTSTALATWLVPPPLPVTTTVKDPVEASDERVRVRVDWKFGVPEGVSNAPVTPDGNPDTASETGELNPFTPWTWTLYEVLWPCWTVWDVGVREIWKSGACVTISDRLTVFVTPPPLPVTVIEYVPGEIVDAVEMLSVELKGGVPDCWLNVPETPGGAPERLSETV